jgi:SAM-dependent methyltransferase
VASQLSRLSILAINRLQAVHSQECHACGRHTSSFYVFGGRPFGCPYCRSSSRERFVLATIEQGRLPFPPTAADILHIAPSERGVVRRLSAGANYILGDLIPGRYDGKEVWQVDMTKLNPGQFGLPGFDLIYASHVLEHIPDDGAALRAAFASLKPGGAAWFLVPLGDGPTEEATPDMSMFERERRFGQWDHVRLYGMDIIERLKSAGFLVETISSCDFGTEAVFRLGLDPADRIFVCRKSC